MKKHRFTNIEALEMSDKAILRLLVLEKRSELNNPYIPLFARLTDIAKKLEDDMPLSSNCRHVTEEARQHAAKLDKKLKTFYV